MLVAVVIAAAYRDAVDGTDLIDLSNALATIRNGSAEEVPAALATIAALEARYCFGDEAVLNELDWAAALSAPDDGRP